MFNLIYIILKPSVTKYILMHFAFLIWHKLCLISL